MLTGARPLARAALTALAALTLHLTAASSLSAQARSGWFHVVYVDAPRGQRPPPPLHGLVDAQGRFTRLVVDDVALRAAGGPRALDGRRVSVSGSQLPDAAPAPGASAAVPEFRVSSLRSLEAIAVEFPPSPSAGSAVDNRPYVMLLCNFSDQQYQPKPKSWYDAILGPKRPNMGHYFDELSFGRLSLAGSAAVGWFTLPHPYLYYYPSGGQSLQFSALLNDCVAAADTQVDFTRFSGIIVQHNGVPGWAYGGRYTLTLDGQTRTFGVTWMPQSGAPQLAHEIGHSLGFPHSSGGYDQVYDSRWDVMSNSYPYFDPSLSPPDWLQQHTIAYNKWLAGWIDGASQLVPALPSTQSVMLLHASKPQTSPGYQLVKVTNPAVPGTFYLAEARQQVGYDRGVPGDAVVLHTFDPSRTEPAHVVDVDRNYDPNDGVAMWTLGESFADSLLGLTIDVDSVKASGFGITLVRGWRLRMQATGPGSIAGAPNGVCSARCDHIAATRGATFTLTAQPNAGAQFLGWSGACTGTSTCAVALAGNRAVVASFAVPVTLSSAAQRPRAIVGRPYTDKLVATGGLQPINWAVTGGALPPGVALASSTGVLSGQPTKEGVYDFTVTATSGTLTSQKAFTIVAVRPVVIVTNAALPRAVTGMAYSQTLAADGGVGTVSWSISSGALPAGLALAPTTGTLAGTPTVAGTYEFTVLAASDTLRDTRKLTLSITAQVAITSASQRRGAVMGAAFEDTLRATGGNEAFDWQLIDGAPPPGLTLASATGVLSGVPTTSGTFRFTAAATSDGITAQREFELTVGKPTLAVSAVLDLLLGGSSSLTPADRGFLDLLGNRNGRVDLGDVRAWLVDIAALPAGAPPSESMAALTRLREQQSAIASPRTTRAPAATESRGARP